MSMYSTQARGECLPECERDSGAQSTTPTQTSAESQSLLSFKTQFLVSPLRLPSLLCLFPSAHMPDLFTIPPFHSLPISSEHLSFHSSSSPPVSFLLFSFVLLFCLSTTYVSFFFSNLRFPFLLSSPLLLSPPFNLLSCLLFFCLALSVPLVSLLLLSHLISSHLFLSVMHSPLLLFVFSHLCFCLIFSVLFSCIKPSPIPSSPPLFSSSMSSFQRFSSPPLLSSHVCSFLSLCLISLVLLSSLFTSFPSHNRFLSSFPYLYVCSFLLLHCFIFSFLFTYTFLTFSTSPLRSFSFTQSSFHLSLLSSPLISLPLLLYSVLFSFYLLAFHFSPLLSFFHFFHLHLSCLLIFSPLLTPHFTFSLFTSSPHVVSPPLTSPTLCCTPLLSLFSS